MATQNDATVHATIEEHSKMFRDVLLGFIKVHVLYQASVEPVFGVGIMEKLHSRGYNLSPGTLYPVLHLLESTGLLARTDRVVGGKMRKYYEITPLGKLVLDDARRRAIQLVDQISQPKRRAAKHR